MGNKVNYKLVNIILVLAIVCLLYLIRGLWLGIVSKMFAILLPFIIAFAVAYALYPLVKKLENAGFPRWLANLIILIIMFGLLITIIILLIPLLYDQALLFLSNISTFINDLSTKFAINLGVLQSSVSDVSSGLIKTVGSSISNGAISIVSASVGFFATAIVVIFVSIYLLIDMEKIRESIKNFIGKKRKKTYNYIKTLDIEVTNYFSGLGKNIIIQFFEYTIIFFAIGHPNYLMLGLLCAFSTIIPIFGGLIVNVVAILIASVISPTLFWLTIIVCCICPQLDNYIIAPKVYGKTNQLHPLISIFAVFAGGILGGALGIIISLPLTIIIITTYKYFKFDIDNKIDAIKAKK